MKKYILIAVLVLAGGRLATQAQQIAIHTNALTDVFCMPNLGVEMTVAKKSTVDLDVTGSWNIYGKEVKQISVQPEYRYWFSNRPMWGWFVGAGAIVSFYNIKWNEKHYQGTAAGGGLTFGYAFKLGKHWDLTLHGACSLVGYWQKENYVKDNIYPTIDGNTETNSRGTVFMPSNIGVTFSYLIK